MSAARLAFALGLGAFLGAAPFLRYAGVGTRGEAHADHAPRHGGQLGMVGDHHLEVVRRGGRVEVFVSDAWRRPLSARTGHLRFDRAATRTLSRHGEQLIGPDIPDSREIEASVTLPDGTELVLSFDFEPQES